MYKCKADINFHVNDCICIITIYTYIRDIPTKLSTITM